MAGCLRRPSVSALIQVIVLNKCRPPRNTLKVRCLTRQRALEIGWAMTAVVSLNSSQCPIECIDLHVRCIVNRLRLTVDIEINRIF